MLRAIALLTFGLIATTTVVAADNGTWCFVAKEGKAIRKPVILGLKGGNEVEIVSGLDDGDWVIQPKGASLTDGQNVELAIAPPAK